LETTTNKKQVGMIYQLWRDPLSFFFYAMNWNENVPICCVWLFYIIQTPVWRRAAFPDICPPFNASYSNSVKTTRKGTNKKYKRTTSNE
jgi:hypothetical protein